MINVRAIDELAQRLATLVPPGFDAAKGDLAKTFRATLQSGLERLNLVTREEDDFLSWVDGDPVVAATIYGIATNPVQRLVLLRSREKLEALEKRFAQLEAEQRSP